MSKPGFNRCAQCNHRIESQKRTGIWLTCRVYPGIHTWKTNEGIARCFKYDGPPLSPDADPDVHKVALDDEQKNSDELCEDLPPEARRDLDKLQRLISESEFEWATTKDPKMLTALKGLIQSRQSIMKQYRGRKSFKRAASTSSEELNKMLEAARQKQPEMPVVKLVTGGNHE